MVLNNSEKSWCFEISSGSCRGSKCKISMYRQLLYTENANCAVYEFAMTFAPPHLKDIISWNYILVKVPVPWKDFQTWASARLRCRCLQSCRVGERCIEWMRHLTRVSPLWAAAPSPRALECYWGQAVALGKRLRHTAAQVSSFPRGWSSSLETPDLACWTQSCWSGHKK